MSKDRLKRIRDEWVETGRQPQKSSEWSRSRANWIKDLSGHRIFVEELPEDLDRKNVRQIVKSQKHGDPQKFLATMIWGYGDVGYGPFRVRNMFQADRFEEKLRRSYVLASSGDAIGAYEYLAREKIPRLGPAFGTKWLFFIGDDHSACPIYDSIVSKWVERYAKAEFKGVSTSSAVWNVKTYSRYLDWMHSNSQELGIDPGDLELIIFRDAFEGFPTRSKWSNL